MEIQQLGSGLIDSPTLQQPKRDFSTQSSISSISYLYRKPITTPHKVKKFTHKRQANEPYEIIPQGKKNLNFNYVYSLSTKKLLEAEIVLDYAEGTNLFYLLVNSFKKFRNVKKIVLKLNNFWKLDLTALKRFIKSLSLLKSLKELCIHLPYHSRYNDKEFIRLWKPLAKIKHLENISMTVHISYGIKGSVLEGIHIFLNKLESLKNIDLNFMLSENNYKYKPVRYETTLLQQIKQQSEGKFSFRLDIPFLLERKELLHVLNTIYTLKNLKCLMLDFTSFAERVDGEIICYLLNILSHIDNIVSLELSFELCWFLDETYIINLMRAICRLKSIKSLKLNFGACFEITDRSIYRFSDYLLQLSELELLSMNYHSCYQINDASVGHLIKSISGINSLKQLDLTFSNCYKLTPEIAKDFGLFSSLQALSLGFEGCTRMNETILSTLSASLSLYNNLEALNLNFSYLANVTNYDICILGSTLAGLKSLKHLSLDIVGFKNLTDTAFINLFRKIGTLKGLSYLGLNLRYVSHITDKAISVLTIILGGLNKIKGLRIDLLGANFLTENCYPKLVQLFSKLDGSKKVSILI